jgi:hypothetical protein
VANFLMYNFLGEFNLYIKKWRGLLEDSYIFKSLLIVQIQSKELTRLLYKKVKFFFLVFLLFDLKVFLNEIFETFLKNT